MLSQLRNSVQRSLKSQMAVKPLSVFAPKFFHSTPVHSQKISPGISLPTVERDLGLEAFSFVVDVGRVVKVTRGGRMFSFRALAIVGNKNGIAGFGTGRGLEVSKAVETAMRRARRNLYFVNCGGLKTIPHETEAHVSQTSVSLRPSRPGSGIRASRVVSAVCEAFGVEDVGAKVRGRTTEMNVVMATFEALARVEAPQEVAERRGMVLVDSTVKEVMGYMAKDSMVKRLKQASS